MGPMLTFGQGSTFGLDSKHEDSEPLSTPPPCPSTAKGTENDGFTG